MMKSWNEIVTMDKVEPTGLAKEFMWCITESEKLKMTSYILSWVK